MTNNKIKTVLVTGGAGFVGTHVSLELINRGFKVKIFDNLDPQVHGKIRGRPTWIPKKAEWVRGDVTDPKEVEKVVKNVDAIIHLAAAVGVGQSMYQIRHYINTNSMGVATLLESLVRNRKKIKKIIVASSMSIYGEGAYRCPKCGPSFPRLRKLADMKNDQWEIQCQLCGSPLQPIPTPETKPLAPTSIYAVSKRDHEENTLIVGQSYGIPAVALRFFNIYGPFQSLSNPYTGVAAIFSSRILNSQSPLIFEDGRQSRDFIHVIDIARACIECLTNPQADYEVFNVGTGRPTSVQQMAELLLKHLKSDCRPTILKKFREGDVRHCYADVSKIKTRLGFEPSVKLENGIDDLISWVRHQTATDKVDSAVKELHRFGLVR